VVVAATASMCTMRDSSSLAVLVSCGARSSSERVVHMFNGHDTYACSQIMDVGEWHCARAWFQAHPGVF
jgi:hypothetical protein